jgi:DNA-binding transcriptional LysR family regulator
LLADLEDADKVADQFRSEPQGTLRVTAPVTYGIYQVVPAVAEYMEKYQQVKVELTLNDRVVDLVEEGIEIAIRSGKIEGASLVARPIRSHKMILAASPLYLQKQGTPKEPNDLLQHNCLGFMPWGKSPIWRLSKGDETVSLTPNSSFSTNNGQALKQAALKGIGIVLQSEALLQDAILDGKLIPVLPEWALPTRPVHIVRTQNTKPTQKVRTFIDFMVEKLGP